MATRPMGRPLARSVVITPTPPTAMLNTPAGNIHAICGAKRAYASVSVAGWMTDAAKGCSRSMNAKAPATPGRPRTRQAANGCGQDSRGTEGWADATGAGATTMFAMPITVANPQVRAHPEDPRIDPEVYPTRCSG